jgi:hypothetical protein
LENNDEAYLRERMLDEPTVAAAAVSHVQASLQAARPGLPLTNAISTASAVLPDVPADERSKLADQISVLVLREPEALPKPANLLNVIQWAGKAHTSTLIQKLTMFAGDPEGDAERARCILALARTRPGDRVLRRALEQYFIKLPETSAWPGVSPWLDEADSMTSAEQNLVLGPWFFAAIVRSTIGAPEGSISVDEGEMAARLLEAASDEVRSSEQVAESIVACCEAEGKEPRWFAVRMMGSLLLTAGNTETVLEAQNDVVLGPANLLYDETIALAMTNFVNWAGQPALLASVSIAEAGRTIAHLAAGFGREKEEIRTEAAKGAQLAAGIWPSQVDGLTEALIADLVEHRSADDRYGLLLRDAALAILPNASDEHAAQIGNALLDPLAGSTDESADETVYALDALRALVSSDAGREIAEMHTANWRARFNTTVAVASELRTPASALGVAAAGSALPEDQEASLWSRVQQLPQYGQVMTTVAVETAARLPWRNGRRHEVATFLGAHWAASSDETRRWILSNVSRWAPQQDELSDDLSEHFVSMLIEDSDEPAREGYLEALWEGFTAEDHARLAAQLHVSNVVRSRLSGLSEEEIFTALRDAGNLTAGLVAALSDAANPATASALRRHVEASIFDSTHGWADDFVRLSLALINAAEAGALADRSLEGLGEGSAVAARAASVLGWLREREGSSLAHLSPRLIENINSLLPGSDPDLAGRLGHASRGIAKTEFEAILRSMRKRTAEQEAREAASAFVSGRSES